MGALIVVMLWLGINIAIELLGEDKPKDNKKLHKKQVIKTPDRNYNFDLFCDTEEANTFCFKKSA